MGDPKIGAGVDISTDAGDLSTGEGDCPSTHSGDTNIGRDPSSDVGDQIIDAGDLSIDIEGDSNNDAGGITPLILGEILALMQMETQQ